MRGEKACVERKLIGDEGRRRFVADNSSSKTSAPPSEGGGVEVSPFVPTAPPGGHASRVLRGHVLGDGVDAGTCAAGEQGGLWCAEGI